jgi:hypothetical protein
MFITVKLPDTGLMSICPIGQSLEDIYQKTLVQSTYFEDLEGPFSVDINDEIIAWFHRDEPKIRRV